MRTQVETDEQFISSIHNYCDRWCERCEFTARCRVFAAEQEMTEEEKGMDNDAFVQNLLNILQDAAAMLREKAAEFGIEIADEKLEESIRNQESKRAVVRSDELARLAEEYATRSGTVLKATAGRTEDRSAEDDIQTDIFQILYWYQYFISAKIQRGLNGIVDDEGGEETDQIEDPQSDANGSIKIALIAIERSTLAWTYLLNEENSEVLMPVISLLQKIEQLTIEKFPNARDFVRPGFDEIETMM